MERVKTIFLFGLVFAQKYSQIRAVYTNVAFTKLHSAAKYLQLNYIHKIILILFISLQLYMSNLLLDFNRKITRFTFIAKLFLSNSSKKRLEDPTKSLS